MCSFNPPTYQRGNHSTPSRTNHPTYNLRRFVWSGCCNEAQQQQQHRTMAEKCMDLRQQPETKLTVDRKWFLDMTLQNIFQVFILTTFLLPLLLSSTMLRT